jgi:hypothetical protein
VSPLLALIQQCQGEERRSAAMNLRLLGAAAASAAPVLLELAQRETGDPEYDYAVSLALRDLGKILGVRLLDQIPLRPGHVEACSHCAASGNCYCKRKGMADWEQCARCDGTGKCHICKGTGRCER